ncbi:hypothetical protein EYF80_021306 [Liparis tanakae]|uniref:Uncharacterized protein n=1 Tax=Liparis tanakae TaxID=230148 RepID=A0A4Z2HSI7_9TELE|nr:hypothetical protein EYF80_021306 [Liparis tanakae]
MGQRGRSNLRKESGIQEEVWRRCGGGVEEVWILGVPPPLSIRSSLDLKASPHTHLLGIATEELVQKLRASRASLRPASAWAYCVR